MHERRIQQPIDARLVHRLAVDRSGDRGHFLRRRAEVGLEGLECFRIGLRKNLAIVVAGNGDDLSRIVHVRLVEFRAVLLIFVRSVDDVAQVKEECGRRSGFADVKILSHCRRHISLRRIRASPRVANCMKADTSEAFDLLASRRSDDVRQSHDRRSRRRRNRLQLPLDVVEKPRPHAGYGLPCSRGLGGEERMGKSNGLARPFCAGFRDFGFHRSSPLLLGEIAVAARRERRWEEYWSGSFAACYALITNGALINLYSGTSDPSPLGSHLRPDRRQRSGPCCKVKRWKSSAETRRGSTG